MNRYNGNFNIIEDPFGKICVNLESISHDQRDKWIKDIQNISHANVDVSLIVEKVTQDKNGIMISANVTNIGNVGNPSTFACDCDKDFKIGEYLKDGLNSLADNLVVTCDEIADTPNSVVINPSNGINYWIIAVSICNRVFIITGGHHF